MGALPQQVLSYRGQPRPGGNSGSGTVFSISFQPQLKIIPSRTILILTSPTNYAGFDCTGYNLHSTTNQPSFIRLNHQSSGFCRGQWAELGPDFRHTAVFPVEPIKARK